MNISVSASLQPGVALPRVNTKLLDALVAEGLIQTADSEAATLYAKRRQLHVEEALIQMALLDELSLLNFQANFYNTKFVSTKKLSSARMPDSLLKLVPHKLAAKLWVFPVKFDAKAQELSIISVTPDDLDVLKSVQFATRAPKIRALVARPAAIQAAIRAHFEGDSQAFGQIRNAAQTSELAVERDVKRTTLAFGQSPAGPAVSARDANFSLPPASPRETGIQLPPVPTSIAPRGIKPPAPQPPAFQPPAPQPPQQRVRRTTADAQGAPPPPPGPLPPIAAAPIAPAARNMLPPPDLDDSFDLNAAPEIASSVKKAPVGIPLHDYLETLNVFMALLENERGELRNHSVQVARICRRLCERLGIKQEESDAIIMAAYLHDIGKISTFHLTALNVGEYDAYRAAGAQELPDAGADLRVGAAAGRGQSDALAHVRALRRTGLSRSPVGQGDLPRCARARDRRDLRRPGRPRRQSVPQEADVAGSLGRARQVQGQDLRSRAGRRVQAGRARRRPARQAARRQPARADRRSRSPRRPPCSNCV